MSLDQFRSGFNLAFAAIFLLITARAAFTSGTLAYHGFAKDLIPTPHSGLKSGRPAKIWACLYALYAAACLVSIPLFFLALRNVDFASAPRALLVRGQSLEGGLLLIFMGAFVSILGLALGHLAYKRRRETKRGQRLYLTVVFTMTIPIVVFGFSFLLAIPVGVPLLVLLAFGLFSPVFDSSCWFQLSAEHGICAA